MSGTKQKSRDLGLVPALSWLVARIKVLCGDSRPRLSAGEAGSGDAYAVRLGRTVKSLNCVRTLDICIPFSCETNGRISAMNWSFTSSLISS
jgi:hypothetical protein